MATDVFISYSSEDKTVADSACAVLEASAIRCWIAPRDVQPGRSFAGEITRAIQGSKVMVLIFSAHTNNSEQVLREVQLAVNAHLHIVQFRIAEVSANDDLKYYLSTPHWLDALTPPLKTHLNRLATSIKALLPVQSSAPAAEKINEPVAAPAAPLVGQVPPAVVSTGAKELGSTSQTKLIPAMLLIAIMLALLTGIIVWHFATRTAPSVAQASSQTKTAESAAAAAPTAMATAKLAPSASPAESATSDNAKTAAPYFQEAAARKKKGDLLGALQSYDRVLELEPANAGAYNQRANIRYQQGDFDGALADFVKVVQLDYGPIASASHTGMGNVYRDQENFDAALREYNRALSTAQHPAGIYANRGLLRLLQGDAHAALLDYNKALELEPQNASVLEGLAGFYLQTRQWTEAIETIEKVIAADRSTEVFSHLMLWVAESQQNNNSADRNLADYIRKRGTRKSDDWHGYIADFLLGKVEPKDFMDFKSLFYTGDRRRRTEAWYFAGMKRLARGDKSSATGCFQEAVAAGPRSALEYRLARAELKQLGN